MATKDKYRKLSGTALFANPWNRFECVEQAVVFDLPEEFPDGHWGWWSKKGERKEIPFESVAILGNGTVQVDFTLARVGEGFSYFDGTTTQNDTVPAGGVWTVPNTVKVNTFTTLDGNIWNLENTDQPRIWCVNALAAPLDIVNVSIVTDIVTDNRFISYANEYGYKLSGSEIIPPYIVDGKAVSAADGGELTNKGAVRYPVKAASNACIIGDTVAKLQFKASQDGETLTYRNAETKVETSVTYNHATNWLIPSVYIDLIKFSGGSEYHCAEVEGDTISDIVNNNDGLFVTATLAVNRTDNDKAEPHNTNNGFSQKLVCETVGTTSIPFAADLSTQEYTWEVDFKFPTYASSSQRIIYLNPRTITGGGGSIPPTDFYGLGSHTSNVLRFFKWNGTVFTVLWSTDINYLTDGEKYRIKVVRTALGEFTTYIKGGIYTNYTLVVPSSGTNPVVDTTYTSSNFVSFDLDTGDEVKNLSINSNHQNLMATTDGTGTYSKVRISAKTSVLDVEGDELSNPAGKWHNRSESTLLWHPCYNTTEIDATLSVPFLTSDGVTPVEKSYADFEAEGGNVYNENQIFYNLDYLREIVSFEKDAKDNSFNCFVRALLKIRAIEPLLDEFGEVYVDEFGEKYYVILY